MILLISKSIDTITFCVNGPCQRLGDAAAFLLAHRVDEGHNRPRPLSLRRCRSVTLATATYAGTGRRALEGVLCTPWCLVSVSTTAAPKLSCSSCSKTNKLVNISGEGTREAESQSCRAGRG